MAPVHPKRHETPILLSGPEAEAALPVLTSLGMLPRVTGVRVGEASSIKMLRSVMIKGLEALTAEAMLAARKAGVEGAVIASLQASDPGIDWEKRSAYNLERMMVHGERRAAKCARSRRHCANWACRIACRRPSWIGRPKLPHCTSTAERLRSPPGQTAFSVH